MDLERLFVPLAEAGLCVEERAGGSPTIRGISPPWRSMSYDLGGFREQFVDTAFDEALAESPDVLGLFNHSEDNVLSRTTSGTLRLGKQPEGLGFAMDAPDTSLARDLMVLIRRGDISGASFAFSLRGPKDAAEEFRQEADGSYTRTVKNANIYDVSIVTRPAYPRSTVALRSFEEFKREQLTEAERQQLEQRTADHAADAVRRRRDADIAAASAIARARVYGM
jgi:HK97 family phage prohead protease